MTLLAAALALAVQAHQPPNTPPETEEGRAHVCQMGVRQNPEAALASALRWVAASGSLHARGCVGLAYSALGRWPLAASTFEQAAQVAERASDPRAADFWVQSGNAWLAAGDTPRAMLAFDTALASRHLTPELRGEVRLDRARALVAAGRATDARADIDQALQLVPGDPMAWYLSAELARRGNDMARARTDIGRARELARDHPDILLLAGTIAGQAGDMVEAERLYRQIIAAHADTDAGRAAAAALATVREVEVPAPAGGATAAPTPAPTPTPPPTPAPQ